jgi:hypothetical protein
VAAVAVADIFLQAAVAQVVRVLQLFGILTHTHT